MEDFKKATALAVATCLFVTGCATPPAFVSAKAATPELNLRFESIECSRLATLLALEEQSEKEQSSDMAGRATRQLLLNAVGVAALAFGGVGMAWTVRGEGDRRDQLAASRGEIEVMKKVLAEKRCRPDVPRPEPGSEAAIAATAAALAANPTVTPLIAELGGSNCAEGNTTSDPNNYLKRGRLLSSISLYTEAMHCLVRATEIDKGSQTYREACQMIAMMYELGWGVEPNAEAVREWRRKAAE